MNSSKYLILLSFVIFSFSVVSQTVAKNNTALVIIDMQPKFVTRGGDHEVPKNIKKVEEIIRNQLLVIEEAKRLDLPIVVVEYKNFGETARPLQDAVSNYKNVKFFLKDEDGMFSLYNTWREDLVQFLNEKNVGNLIIMGANGGACVDDSIEGAITKYKYKVVAFSKGIADFNYREFIYPYDDRYRYKTDCDGCLFREVDEVADVSMIMTAQDLKNIGSVNWREFVNDNLRKAGKNSEGEASTTVETEEQSGINSY